LQETKPAQIRNITNINTGSKTEQIDLREYPDVGGGAKELSSLLARGKAEKLLDIIQQGGGATPSAPLSIPNAVKSVMSGLSGASNFGSRETAPTELDLLLKEKERRNGTKISPSNDGITPPVTPEREAPDLPLYNPKQEASANPSFDTAMETVFKNEGGHAPEGSPTYLGIDSTYWPKEYKEAVQIGKTGGEDAAKEYAKNFYKTHFWDKYDLDNVPPEVQEVAMDGAVNHRSVFVKRLINAAKSGASKDKQLKMREAEYNRIARSNPSKKGNLEGWKNRVRSMKDDEYKVARR